MSRFDNPYDAAEYAYQESERREYEAQRREDEFSERFWELRAEKQADDFHKDCIYCSEYFSKWSCGANRDTGECDCPKCQGLCECKQH